VRISKWRLASVVMILAVAVLLASRYTAAQSTSTGLPTIVVVRHANKAALPKDDPPLTPAGVKRSQDLASVLHAAGVTGIVTTHLLRTRDTAAPLAAANGITPVVIQRGPRRSIDHLKSVEAAIRRYTGTVLVVGHDDTVPGLIGHLGGPQMPDICESVYDNLFILVPSEGKTKFVHARYGDPTPDSECKH